MKNGIIFSIITALLFTTHEPVSKLFAGEINPYAITAIRFFIGSLFLLPFSFREIIKEKKHVTKKDLGIMTALGILFICVSMVLLQVGVAIADSPALIAIIFSSNSVFTILLSAIFLHNKLTKTKIAGIILCIIAVLFSADLTQGSNILSIILGILSALIFSIYTVLCKKYLSHIGGVIQTGITFFISSVILLIVLSILGIDILGGISRSNILLVLYISVLVTGVGYWAYSLALKKGGPQIAAIAFFVKPILTPLATFLINGIVPSYTIIIALIFMIAGVFLCGGMYDNMKDRLKN